MRCWNRALLSSWGDKARQSHMELLGVAALFKTSCEGKARERSGGRQEEPTTADGAQRDAASPSLELSEGSARIREGREGGLEVSCSPGSSSTSIFF